MMGLVRFGRSRHRSLEFWLGALCLLLAGLTAYQLWRPPLDRSDITSEIAARAATPAAPRPSFAIPPIEAFAEFVARPLFVATRRPAPLSAPTGFETPAALATPTPTPQPLALNQVTLVGITITPEGRSALLRVANPGKFVRVQEGDLFQGWAVKRIETDTVSFAWASSQIDVNFPVRGSPAAARPVAAVSQNQMSASPPAPVSRREPPVMPTMPSLAMPPTSKGVSRN
jgi:hypothetical protein